MFLYALLTKDRKFHMIEQKKVLRAKIQRRNGE